MQGCGTLCPTPVSAVSFSREIFCAKIVAENSVHRLRGSALTDADRNIVCGCRYARSACTLGPAATIDELFNAGHAVHDRGLDFYPGQLLWKFSERGDFSPSSWHVFGKAQVALSSM